MLIQMILIAVYKDCLMIQYENYKTLGMTSEGFRLRVYDRRRICLPIGIIAYAALLYFLEGLNVRFNTIFLLC